MRLHHDAKTERISAIPLFRDAGKDALNHVARAADEVDIAAGTELITQGTIHYEGYIVVSGSVEVDIDGSIVATIGSGQMVGELSLFGHGPASATVRAIEPVVALVIPYNRFDQLLDENPSFVKAIAKELAGRLHAMDTYLHTSAATG